MPRSGSIRGSLLAGALLLAALIPGIGAGSAAAQVHGIPPSVTSIQFHVPPFLPNARPSVTSLGPYPAYNPSPFPQPYGIPRSVCPWGCRHRTGYGYNGGYAGSYFPAYASVPYYYDSTDNSPYVYSGPPPEQTLHVVVDLAPSRRTVLPDYDDATVAPPATVSAHDAPLMPLETTVLVFRDGHQQEVSNYAIMGQTIYLFDNRTRKIGLDEIDVPATVKLNDDRGVDFHLPVQKMATAPTLSAPQELFQGPLQSPLVQTASH
jgi:hypothetical protein